MNDKIKEVENKLRAAVAKRLEEGFVLSTLTFRSKEGTKDTCCLVGALDTIVPGIPANANVRRAALELGLSEEAVLQITFGFDNAYGFGPNKMPTMSDWYNLGLSLGEEYAQSAVDAIKKDL